jgi:hypothetical protein
VILVLVVVAAHLLHCWHHKPNNLLPLDPSLLPSHPRGLHPTSLPHTSMLLHSLRRRASSLARPLLPPFRLKPLLLPLRPTTTTTRSVSHHGPRRVVIVPRRPSGQREPPPPPPPKRGLPPYFYVLGIATIGGTTYYYSSLEETPYTGRKRPMFVSRQTELQVSLWDHY